MTVKRKVPEIRFKGFGGEWEERRLGEISESYSGGTPTVGHSEYYSGKIPFIRSAEINSGCTELFITQEGLANSSAKMVSAGDILYALYGATSGEVGRSRLTGAINQAILAIKTNDNYDAEFITQWLKKQKGFIINTYLQGGQGNLSGSLVKDFSLLCSCFAEQTQIGTFFQNLDSLITLHQRKYDKLTTVKKAMLEKMFPKDEADVPEIRFKGFAEKWERRQLGEVSETIEYGLNASAMEFDGKNKYLRITDIDDVSHKFRTDDLTSPNIDLALSEKYTLKEGDILFARTGASVGKSYIYDKGDELVYFAGFLIRARISPKYNAEFIFQNTLTIAYDNFVKIMSQRSGQPGINAQEYGEYSFMFPEQEEQSQIGIFFNHLDSLITLQQRELDKLKNIKKACLERMFV